MSRVFRHPLLLRRAIMHLRLLSYGLGDLKKRHPHAGPGRHKYLNLNVFIHRALYICREVGLIGGPSKRVLDIGCGSGLLLFCMGQIGHDAIGIDIEDDFYRDYAAKLGVDRRIERVQPFVPLQVTGGPFDVVTAIAVGFDCYHDAEGNVVGYWGAEEWRYFLADVRSKLTEDGRFFLILNFGDEYPEVTAAFRHAQHRDPRHRYLFDRAALDRSLIFLSGGQAGSHVAATQASSVVLVAVDTVTDVGVAAGVGK